MKALIIVLSLISLLSFSSTLPHFTFNGIESFQECSKEKGKIYLYIIGSLSEEANSATIEPIKIKKMGEFQCALGKTEGEKDPARSHVITCSIEGNFEPSAHILKEPKVNGFDFLDENGESTWPTEPEKATFLIGECGEKVELDKEELLSYNSERSGLLAGDIYKDPIKSIRNDVIDKALKFLPKRSITSKDKMISQMKSAKQRYSLSDMEAAYMVYKWEHQNLKYDCYNFENDLNKIDFSEDGTYSSGVGVCEGFAKLYEAMCKGMGIEAYRVVGYSKGSFFTPGEIPENSDHSWNAIKINGNYYLIDVTWGIGTCDGEKYIPRLKDSFFCPDPEKMIKSHLPADKKYQLVYPNLTLRQFVDQLMLTMEFFDYGLKKVTPDEGKIDSRGKIEIEITYGSSDVNINYLYHLYLLGEDEYYYEEKDKNACWINRKETSATFICNTNFKGEYLLEVYAGHPDEGIYSQLFQYTIDSTRSAYKPIYFPHPYNQYSNSYLELIEPLNDPLIRGNLIDFKVRTTTFDNLYVLSGGLEIELENDGKGLFTGESIYILGENVMLATLKGGEQFSYIAKYTTELDKYAKSEPTYPMIFGAPKNILYSPLMDTLKRGKSYTFKIKCKECKKIGVKDGDNSPIYLTKNNGVFTGTVRIKGPGDVDIIDIQGAKYATYYRYKTS